MVEQGEKTFCYRSNHSMFFGLASLCGLHPRNKGRVYWLFFCSFSPTWLRVTDGYLVLATGSPPPSAPDLSSNYLYLIYISLRFYPVYFCCSLQLTQNRSIWVCLNLQRTLSLSHHPFWPEGHFWDPHIWQAHLAPMASSASLGSSRDSTSDYSLHQKRPYFQINSWGKGLKNSWSHFQGHPSFPWPQGALPQYFTLVI